MAKRKFRETVRSHLDSKKWDQAELARRAGLSPALVSKVLSGDRDLTIGNVLAIARALNVAAADLVAGDPDAEALLVDVVPREEYEEVERERIDAVVALGGKSSEAASLREQLEVAQRQLDVMTRERTNEREALQRARHVEEELNITVRNFDTAQAFIKKQDAQLRQAIAATEVAKGGWRNCEQARSTTHTLLVQAQGELRSIKTIAGVGAVVGLLAAAAKK